MPFRTVRTASLLFTVSASALALTITVTDPHPKFHDQADNCPPSYPQCYDDAYLQTAPLNYGTAGFRAAFDAWNTTTNPNDPWSLRDGGFLDAILEVDKFQATIQPSKLTGGVEIDIIFNYAGADKNDFFWAQGLFDNYDPATGGFIKPTFKMDVKAAGCDDADLQKACPPLYPFQYADRSFYDFPKGPFPNGFFNGYAYPAKINRATRELTVFQGVGYGFQLSVPEPSTWMMLLLGLVFLRIRYRPDDSNRSSRCHSSRLAIARRGV